MKDRPSSPAKTRLERPVAAEIVGMAPLNRDAKLITLALSDEVRLDHRPGQFVQLSAGGVGELPLMICSPPGSGDTFEVVAYGGDVIADALRRNRVGDLVGIRGPFGNGYDLESLAGRDLLMVASEDGVISLRPLLLTALADRDKFGKLILIQGARRPQDHLFRFDEPRLRDAGSCELLESVVEPDRHWTGEVGVVTTLLPRLDIDSHNTTAVVAGPAVMYKFVLLGLRALGIPDDEILLALGHHMQCGRGVCGHCRMYDTYVCKDGPIFSYTQLRGKPGVF